MRATLIVVQYVARVIARYVVMTKALCMSSCDHESGLASMRVILQAWEWWCNTLAWTGLIQIDTNLSRDQKCFWACTKHTFGRTNLAKCLIYCDTSCEHKRVARAMMRSFLLHAVAAASVPIVTSPLQEQILALENKYDKINYSK